MTSDIDSLLQAPFSFQARPKPLDPSDRLSWRLYIVLLTVGEGTSRGGCSLRRLQLLNWAVLSHRHRDALRHALDSPNVVPRLDVRFDPALDQTIAFALASELLEYDQNGKFRLTTAGSYVLQASNDMDVPPFSDALDLMRSIGRKLSEGRISTLLTWGLQ